jgi:hypothetical protein
MFLQELFVQIFGGNMDIKTERRHYLNLPMVARYVRIHPISWRRRIGLRVGVLGIVYLQSIVEYGVSVRIHPISWR